MAAGVLHHQALGAAIAFLTLVPGCAQKTDWVEGTLVTGRDRCLEGTRDGRGRRTQRRNGNDADAAGPKVTGDGRIWAQKMSIEGAVRGDMLSFRGTGGRFHGEAPVTGDEMSGEGRTDRAVTGYLREVRFTLSR